MDQRRSAYSSHPHSLPPHTPTTATPSSTSERPQPPPPPHHYAPGPLPHHQQTQQQPSQHHSHQQQHHPQHHPQPTGPPPPPQQQYPPQPYPGPPQSSSLPPPGPGPALPPIQPGAYAPPPSTTEQQSLPPFHHPPAPPRQHQDPREQEHHSYYNHNRSGHGTPAPVNRSYSHDSGPQRSPATPAGPGPGSYPPASGQDGIPPPAHPQYPPMEHGGHPGYPPPNGAIPHGLPPPGPPPPHHDHQQMTPVMDQHYQYPPPGQPMYGAPQAYGPTSANLYGPKRKQMRATQACEQCRQRKQKCDEGSPCSFCKENSLSCQYRDTPPAKTDKNMEKILVHMEAHSRSLTTLTEKIETFEARLRKVEDQVPPQSSHRQHGRDATAGADREMPAEDPAPIVKTAHVDDHRTAPHKLLLLWPSVRALLAEANVQQNDSYVMEAEDRGILRIWTRGEGIDEHDGTQPGGPASPARSEESGDAGSAGTPHADLLWGVGFPSTPASDVQRSEPMTYEGGLNAQGELDLDIKTIGDLYDSYMRHLHIMHPILDRKRLRKMFETFANRYGTGSPHRASPFAVPRTDSIGREHDADQRPMKRQRSNGPASTLSNGSQPRRSIQTERSPGNAIIYLVLALGKICMHREALPGIVQDSKLQANANVAHHISSIRGAATNSPLSGNIKPSPSESTPTTHPTPPSETNLRLSDSRSRRQSVEGSSPSGSGGPRNLDIIPGLAYFAKAAEILGDQGDGNDLVHAQMFLLAALYKGQLARVKESMSWITMAGRAILNLLDRYKLWNKDYWTAFGDKRSMFDQGQYQIKDTRQSLIVLAAWSCLQLESDILAELKLPSSGIQDIEQRLLFPHRVSEDESYRDFNPDGRQENYDNILLFYTSQLFLRRRLNMIHRELYGAGTDNSSPAEVREILKGHETILHHWRDQLPPSLRWNDDDPPPGDILAARLRAKYWGTRFIANRPFLDYALHIMPHLHADSSKTVEEIAKDGHGNPRDKADIKLFSAIRSMGDEEVWRAVDRCIHAAMKSTVAFDGVAPRLVVTNIHGTAHAQFGNMLVLTAAYRNAYLRRCVPEQKFRQLLDRTISFLRGLAPISPTCFADCGILEKFKNILFPAAEEAPEVYRGEGIQYEKTSSEPMSATNSFNMGT